MLATATTFSVVERARKNNTFQLKTFFIPEIKQLYRNCCNRSSCSRYGLASRRFESPITKILICQKKYLKNFRMFGILDLVRSV